MLSADFPSLRGNSWAVVAVTWRGSMPAPYCLQRGRISLLPNRCERQLSPRRDGAGNWGSPKTCCPSSRLSLRCAKPFRRRFLRHRLAPLSSACCVSAPIPSPRLTKKQHDRSRRKAPICNPAKLRLLPSVELPSATFHLVAAWTFLSAREACNLRSPG
jgi:hypothetical protein